MANDLINHAGVMKPLLNPKGWACKASGLIDTCTKEMQETAALGVDVKAPHHSLPLALGIYSILLFLTHIILFLLFF